MKRNQGKQHNKHKRKEDDSVITNEEAWETLGIGKNTFYEWCRLNRIPHKRVRRRIIISRKRFNDWLENDNEGGIQ